jgi:tetratricopeptide (TPR) repeat protein
VEQLLGRHEEARKHYEDALSLYKAADQRLGRANTHMSLGRLECTLLNMEKGRKHFQEAAIQFGLAGMKKEQAEAKELERKSLADAQELVNMAQAAAQKQESLPQPTRWSFLPSWSVERWCAVFGVLLAACAVVAAFFVPEVRAWFGLKP